MRPAWSGHRGVAAARQLGTPAARRALRGLVRTRTLRWPEHSHFFALGDRGGWSVEEDAEHLSAAARRLGYAVGPPAWASFASRQSVFLTSHFEALDSRWLDSSHRLGTAYLHGRPGTPGFPEFDSSFVALSRRPERMSRVQVTHDEMHELVLAAGVPSDRVFRIPIGIDIEHFAIGDADRRADARRLLDVPAAAFVVGSFQKDGVGWGEGLEPKLIKGPDVLIGSVEHLRAAVPELHVLLTGPARGYVRRELERLRVPYVHVRARSRNELARAYHALDAYVVSSRQEGGPKAVLEAMATGVPLVSTRVGQAQELVEHGVNGWLVDVEDAESLAGIAAHVREGAPSEMRAAARATAERYELRQLDGLWANLLEGFVKSWHR